MQVENEIQLFGENGAQDDIVYTQMAGDEKVNNKLTFTIYIPLFS